MNSFSEIVEEWGRKELADDIGIPKERARQWWRDDSIPPWYWRAMLDKAPSRGIDISPDLLIDLAARE